MTVPVNASGGGIFRGQSDPNPTNWTPDHVNALIAGGGVAKASTGQALKVDIAARKKLWAGVVQDWNALANQAVSDSAVSWVYLDLDNYGSSQDPTIDTSLPSSSANAFILAKITASGGAITEIVSIQELWPEVVFSGEVFTSADETKLDGIEALADVTDAANVAAAGAVMDSDFAGADAGHMIRTGAGAYAVLKHNLSASAAPTANDDSGDGYAVGSLWIDTTNDKVYQCVDATSTAAVWKDLTETAGKLAQEDADPETGAGTTTSAIPADDTLPGSAEGVEVCSLAFTPQNASSKLIIEANVFVAINNASYGVVASLLDDGVAIAASRSFGESASGTFPLTVRAVIDPIGDTDEHTFTLRVGPTNSAATVTYNGSLGSRQFSTTQKAVLNAREILP